MCDLDGVNTVQFCLDTNGETWFLDTWCGFDCPPLHPVHLSDKRLWALLQGIACTLADTTLSASGSLGPRFSR